MKNSSSLLYGFLLLVGDFLALVAAFALAFIFRVKLDERPLVEPITANTYISVIALLLVFWLIIFALLGLYKSHVYENRFSEAGRITIGSFIGILFLIGCEYILNRPIFPARLVMLYGFGISFLMVLLFRTIARAVRRMFFKYHIGLNHVLLVGATNITKQLIGSLSHPDSGFLVVGIVGDKRVQYDSIQPEQQFATFDEATESLNQISVHSIVQTELYAEQDKNDKLLNYAQQNHVAYRFVPGNSDLFAGKISVELFSGFPVVAVQQTALIGWGRIVKRLFDVTFSLFALVILSPLLILITILMKLSDFRGPVLFRQVRLTRFNTEFEVLKFRTHRADISGLPDKVAFEKIGKPELYEAYKNGGYSLDSDPRVSIIGRFLRRTSLDELPQFFNVLKGDLSLVGPRALIPAELNTYEKKHAILSVKSGITGLAQISGREDISFEERRRIDVFYVQNWSFWLDITILFKTIVMVLRGSGAK